MLCGYKFIVLCIQTRRNPSEVLEFSIKIVQFLRHEVRHVKRLPAKLQKHFLVTDDKLSLGNRSHFFISPCSSGACSHLCLPVHAERGCSPGARATLCKLTRLLLNCKRWRLGKSIIDNSEQYT